MLQSLRPVVLVLGALLFAVSCYPQPPAQGVAGQWTIDDDGDGVSESEGDCDDESAAISPSADELCDGVDNDCDALVDEDDAVDATSWHPDSDGDGYGDDSLTVVACSPPEGHVAEGTDCDDTTPAVHPEQVEMCNGVDDDCSGPADESDAVDVSTWYLDLDGDGYGDGGSPLNRCSAPSGYVADDGDCDDANGDIHPGAVELCSSLGVDDDCDGMNDNVDDDNDGFSACGDDCDDAASAIHPGADELLGDPVDSDCDLNTDNLVWIPVDSLGATGLQGVRMVADDANMFYMVWTADNISSSTLSHSNALAVRAIDSAAPLATVSTHVYASGDSAAEFHSAFDVVADGGHLYWGQSRTSSTDNISGITMHVIDLASMTVQESSWVHPGSTSAQPASDVHLYKTSVHGVDHLQAVSCSNSLTTLFLSGVRWDFENQPGDIEMHTDDSEGLPLPSVSLCTSSVQPQNNVGYPLLMLSDGYPSSPHTDVYWAFPAGLFQLLGQTTDYHTDFDSVRSNGLRAYSLVESAAASLNNTTMMEQGVATDLAAQGHMVRVAVLEEIVQVDTDVSASAKVVSCGIAAGGRPYLFMVDPAGEASNSREFVLNPHGSISNWDECSVAISLPGRVAVALRSGDSLVLGVIQLPSS